MSVLPLTLTFDTLIISHGPRTGEPLMAINDTNGVQVVIVDDHEDGPYFDLWNIFAKNPVLGLIGYAKDAPTSTNIIVPLAGGSSPL